MNYEKYRAFTDSNPQLTRGSERIISTLSFFSYTIVEIMHSTINLAMALMRRPMKDTKLNAPMIDPSILQHSTHQADLLFLPHDRGYKYALVVVDLGSRLVDAAPLKSKKADEVGTERLSKLSIQEAHFQCPN